MTASITPTDVDSVIERLQGWMRGVDTVVLGSGASADYKYPLMGALASHLLSVIIPAKNDETTWNIIADKLRSDIDLETAMTDVQLSPALLSLIINATWNLISNRDLEFYQEVIDGYVDFPLSNLIRWLDTGRKRIDVITTNYDRVIEYACDSAGVIWIDGTGFGHFRREMRGFGTHLKDTQHSHLSTVARIWKVHGSLDWFSHQDTEAFLATTLRSDIPDKYSPLVVTPGQTKYAKALSDPFRSILTGSDDIIKISNIFLCVGYGFNDRHVHEKLISKSHDSHSKFIVLARGLTENTKRFLINNGCKNYIAIERGYDDNQSLAWLSGTPDPVTINQNAWSMRGLCSIVM